MLMKQSTQSSCSSNQSGFVSIVVSLIIGVVLSLITIGFAQLMQREQKDVVERQLSTQAFYAAESGVNDAALKLKLDPTSTYYTKDACPTTGPVSISPTGPVEVSCVLVDSTPTELRFDGISTDVSKSKVIPIITSSKPASVTVQWLGSGGGTNFRTSGSDFPPATSWSADAGIVKFTLVPFQAGMSRESLLSATGIAYLNPLSSILAGPVQINYDDIKGLDGQGAIVDAKCSAAAQCVATINNIPGTADEFYLILSSVYKPNSVTITAKDGAGNPLALKGVQTVIDSTGRTNDTLRRIQVRKPIRDDYLYAGGALDFTGPICKLIITSPDETSDTCGL
jgi:Tfp pilus assembly protein PilX